MVNEYEVLVLQAARCHGLRSHVPADGGQILLQTLLVGDAPAEELHRTRGREYARHQHRRREHRLPHHRRAYFVPAAV